jgi:hypothetical protein
MMLQCCRGCSFLVGTGSHLAQLLLLCVLCLLSSVATCMAVAIMLVVLLCAQPEGL